MLHPLPVQKIADGIAGPGYQLAQREENSAVIVPDAVRNFVPDIVPVDAVRIGPLTTLTAILTNEFVIAILATYRAVGRVVV